VTATQPTSSGADASAQSQANQGVAAARALRRRLTGT